jgi:AcrR family transcriptional regulator
LEHNLSRLEREKLVRKSEIIEAAEKLFLKNGFEGTSMEDVAKASQFTKRTVYQYFINKEDLFFAVILKAVEQLDTDYEEALKKGATVLDKIRLVNRAYYRFFKDDPQTFRLLNYKPASRENKAASPNYQEIVKLRDRSFQKYIKLLEEGKAEGSLRPDFDAKKATHFGAIINMGFLNTISSFGNDYWEKHGLEKEDFILYSFDLLTDSLKK